MEERKLHKLYELAESDLSYQVWKRSFEDTRQAFHVYADAQPEAVRNLLYGYAEAGRLMEQRLVNLACKHMVFSEENDERKTFPGLYPR